MVKMAGSVRTQFSSGIRNLYHCARSKHHKSLMPEVFLHPPSAGGICYCFLHSPPGTNSRHSHLWEGAF